MKLSGYLFSVTLVLGGLSLSACAGTGPQSGEAKTEAAAISTASAEDALKAAEAANKKAASVGYEWYDSGDLLKEARDALVKGDSARAVKLAEQVRLFGEAAYVQAQTQKNAGPRF